MKTPIRLALMIFAASLIIVSCAKDDDDDPVVGPDNTSLISAHEWILTNVTLPFPLNAINAWDSMPACEKDNFYKFDANNTGYIDHGALKCDTAFMQRETFVWLWKDNETTIEIPGDSLNDALIFKNVVITATTMTAKTDWEEGGISVKANLTFGVH